MAPTSTYYAGTEFALSRRGAERSGGEHCCEAEGCWHFLGVGHAREAMCLRDGDDQVCAGCGEVACFELRAAGAYGWANAAERHEMLRGFSVAQPQLGFGARC